MAATTAILFLMLTSVTSAHNEGEISINNGESKFQSAMNIRNATIKISMRGLEVIIRYLDPSLETTVNSVTSTTERISSDEEYDSPDEESLANVGDEGCSPIDKNYTAPKTGRPAWDKCIEYQEKLVYPCTLSDVRISRCHHDTEELIGHPGEYLCMPGRNLTDEERERCKYIPARYGKEMTAEEMEFPHMALLGYRTNSSAAIFWRCQGTVISEKFILTSASCIPRRNDTLKYVRVGVTNIKTEIDSSQMYKIKNIFRHPEYNIFKIRNDIALFETELTMILSDKVVPACLPVDVAQNTESAILTSWRNVNRTFTDPLEKIPLDKFTDSDCLAFYGPSGAYRSFDKETQMCYGDKSLLRDNCKLYTGGSLVIRNKKIRCMYTIIGIQSYGKVYCKAMGLPNGFTKVSAYLPWIESIVWPNSTNTY